MPPLQLKLGQHGEKGRLIWSKAEHREGRCAEGEVLLPAVGLFTHIYQGPSKAKCINKSEGEIPGLLYTVANKAENPFFMGSEQIVGKKTEALPLLLKTAGTDNSKNA